MELEEQLRLKDSLARLGELTAGLAHEFRNGLATIHGYSRLIDVEALAPKYQPYVEGIRQETEALGKVVTNFLSFARPENMALSRVDLGAVVRRAADDLRYDTDQSFRVPPRPEVRVEQSLVEKPVTPAPPPQAVQAPVKSIAADPIETVGVPFDSVPSVASQGPGSGGGVGSGSGQGVGSGTGGGIGPGSGGGTGGGPYQPGVGIGLHDHTFEEAYFILSGEVEGTLDGRRYTATAGDVLWTGVGCVHAFKNVSREPVRWLETFAPQPPKENVFRFMAEWDARAKELEGEQ